MKLVKSLLLGSAAGLFAVAGAQAADLPVKKAAPVDYVRVCSTYGTGYWFIPGTDICMRISGFARADYLYVEQPRSDFDETGFRARGRLNFDFRQPTEYGLLRAFVRYEITRNTGVFVGSGQGATTTPFFGSVGASSADVPLAYVQFGGFTAGRVQSFFDFWANDDIFTTLLGVSDVKTQTLAYTATFGSGWSATIAIEDPNERKSLNNGLDLAGFPATIFGPGFVALDADDRTPVAVTSGGTKAPDVLGILRVDQAWGSAQLAVAAHEIRAGNLVGVDAAGSTVAVLPGGAVGLTDVGTIDSEWGYAIQGGVKFNLPMIAAGDQLWLQAAYGNGATGYTHTSPFTTARAGTFRLNTTEAVIDPFTGDIEKTESWSVSGKLLHYWLPNLRSNFFAAYSELDYADVGSRAFVNPDGFIVNQGFVDLRIIEAGANLIWSPVKGLDIGVEGVYRKFETSGNVAPAFGPTIISTGVGDRNFGAATDNQDVWEARLRVQRDF
jgi:hypothetical protein